MESMKNEPATCPSDPLLRLLWGQWKTHVLHALGTNGPLRFGQLQRALPSISPKVLTQRLRELERDGLVWREHEPSIPPKVTYGLTDMGRDVHAALTALEAPARKWLGAA
jgi:DNA-binding HxlR family transcriptional regulator